MRKKHIYFVGLLVFAVALMHSPISAKRQTAIALQSCKISVPMEVELTFAATPLLNQLAVLNLRVKALKDSPNTAIKFELPANAFKRISGAMELTESLSAGETRIYTIEVLPIARGQYHIVGGATSRQASYMFGKRSELFVNFVNESTTILSRTAAGPPKIFSEGRKVSDLSSTPKQTPAANKPRHIKLAASLAAPGPGQIAVRGCWLYKNRTDVDKPLRDARVEIWDHNTSAADRLLSTTYANKSGCYESGVIANTDAEGGTLDVFVKVFSTDDYSVHVTDSSLNLYSFQSPTTNNFADGFVDIGTYSITDADNRMAYYIYDTIANDAYDYLFSAVGWANSYNVSVKWPSNEGTFYQLAGGIDLVAGDRWDSDVFLHEYGHFVMDKIYAGNYPPTPNCNPHFWGGPSSLGCGWSEGWADFLQGAIQNDRFYDDTEDISLHIDFEPPDPDAQHADDEGGVTASLWDVFDSNAEPWDAISTGINGASSNGVWRVFGGYLPNDFIEFYNDWLNSSNGFESEVTSIFHHHLIVSQSSPTTVQFSNASYTAGEGAGSAKLTVTRTGDTSGTMTVDYATAGTTAFLACNAAGNVPLQNCDYTIASGTLTFAPGESSKDFVVLLIDDGYQEDSELLPIALSSPTGGAALGSLKTTTLTILDNDSVVAATSPLDDARYFVRQHYLDFLNRSPDTGGWDYWSGQISNCGADQTCVRDKRIDVSNAFFYELEYQQTGAYIFRLYRAAYGNNQPFPNPGNSNPDEAHKLVSYTVFARDRARVVGGANLATGQSNIAHAFVLRPEFLTRYPATLAGPAFVDAVINNMRNDLDVDLSSQRAALINLFNTGGRGAVMYRLADDDAATNPINNRAFIDEEYNRAFVATQYFGYLRRNPDIGGFLFWLGQVNGAPLRDVARQHAMVCSFITSAEYQQRFSATVTHTNGECPQ